MSGRRAEALGFCVALAACVGVFLHEGLRSDRALSPADVLLVQASFRDPEQPDYEPLNRLLMDPVLQFQPWITLNRSELQAGRLPLWNPYAGCGVPHLANGQSAVFDPFNLLIHFGPMPAALAWVAALRLWFAGVGAFFLARAWGLNVWGRWFAGLVFPFCGFLVVWLLYYDSPTAIWLPWILLTTDRAVRRPSLPATAQLAVCVGGSLVAGHVQTGAHLLMAAGGLVLWRLALDRQAAGRRRTALLAWGAGTALGVGIAAVQILPLGVYLTKSPVWGERHREHPAWWRLTRPRLLESACVGLPYLYGSQRRGQPNLARGLGLDNLNESAGSYAGLATLVWLAPLGLLGRRRSEVGFLAVLLAVGAMGAYRIPPVDNLLRALPVIGVTDNRRLTLWVAFALTFLGAHGMDRLARGTLPSRRWVLGWLAGAVVLSAAAAAVPLNEATIRTRAERRYANPAGEITPEVAQLRAERQIRAALEFTPRYLGTAAAELLLLAALVEAARRSGKVRRALPVGALGVALVELFGFGMGLNPAIDRSLQNRESPVIARLREGLGTTRRALGVGEELPPNVLTRFGLADARNYDSIELGRSLDWFEPLYEPTDEARSSRRTVSWRTVETALPRLEQAAVAAVVAATTPPKPELFERVERVGAVWIAWLKSTADWVEAVDPPAAVEASRPSAGSIRVELPDGGPRRVIVRETWDPGWSARVDGQPMRIDKYLDTFMSINLDKGARLVELDYAPREARLGLWISATSAGAAILGLTGGAWIGIYGMVGRRLGRNRAARPGSA